MKNYQKKLKALEERIRQKKDYFISMPANLAYDYSELIPFWSHSINNIGDPFEESSYPLQAKEMEREVLEYFANLYSMDSKNYWGYVTTGGTEGNVYGLFLGREVYPDGILYFSEDSHYSLSKTARILNMETTVVPSHPNGEIVVEELVKAIKRSPDKPVILSVNFGTTMKGSIDDLDSITQRLKEEKIDDYYIHVDAALAGMVVPFLKDGPKIDFQKYPIDSVALSGHKFIGAPFPCGVVLARKSNFDAVGRHINPEIEYIASVDTTITGSRNGLATVFLWYALQKRKNSFASEVRQCMKNAKYLEAQLKKRSIETYRNPYSTVVYFTKPSERLIKKWSLSIQKNFTHVVCMLHVTKGMLDRFLEDLDEDGN